LNVVVRRADAADVESILRIEQACAGAAPQWGESVWVGILALDERGVFVAEGAGLVCGFVAASSVAGVAELESVAVEDAARRQGVGRMLCERVMEWGRQRGVTAMQLEVRAASEGALRMYRALGFVEQGRRAKYYRHPEDDAVMMNVAL
jgi:ribosomal-protein-alanine N-acetyltransferase